MSPGLQPGAALVTCHGSGNAARLMWAALISTRGTMWPPYSSCEGREKDVVGSVCPVIRRVGSAGKTVWENVLNSTLLYTTARALLTFLLARCVILRLCCVATCFISRVLNCVLWRWNKSACMHRLRVLITFRFGNLLYVVFRHSSAKVKKQLWK